MGKGALKELTSAAVQGKLAGRRRSPGGAQSRREQVEGRDMTVFVALLRAVNVGGTGMLPMKDLAALCTKLGFENVRTYIQTGNVVFTSRLLQDSRSRVDGEGARRAHGQEGRCHPP